MLVGNSSFKPGELEVYCGSMKSGKSRELINRLDRIRYVMACKSVFMKPSLDTRDKGVTSRNSAVALKCILVDVNHPEKILDYAYGTQVVGIDEFHLFNKDVIPVIDKLIHNNHNVIISGLDLDFRGEPFGAMPEILSMANSITKLAAVCQYVGCTRDATRTQRLVNGDPAPYDAPLILIGDSNEGYEARCLMHHFCEK